MLLLGRIDAYGKSLEVPGGHGEHGVGVDVCGKGERRELRRSTTKLAGWGRRAARMYIGRRLCTRTVEIYTAGYHKASGLWVVRLDAMTHQAASMDHAWWARAGRRAGHVGGACEWRCATRGVRV